MSKSLFTNVNSYKSLLTKNTTDEVSLIQKLLNSKFTVDIQNVINYYCIGDFKEVLNILNKENLVYYSNLLYSYKKSSIVYPTYEKVRLLLKFYLDGLAKCIAQFLDIENIKLALEKSQERAQILDDMEKLQEYIDGLNRTVNLFKPTEPIAIVEAKILPEHVAYLRMYGYPVGGIFDPQLLNNIFINK